MRQLPARHPRDQAIDHPNSVVRRRRWRVERRVPTCCNETRTLPRGPQSGYPSNGAPCTATSLARPRASSPPSLSLLRRRCRGCRPVPTDFMSPDTRRRAVSGRPSAAHGQGRGRRDDGRATVEPVAAVVATPRAALVRVASRPSSRSPALPASAPCSPSCGKPDGGIRHSRHAADPDGPQSPPRAADDSSLLARFPAPEPDHPADDHRRPGSGRSAGRSGDPDARVGHALLSTVVKCSWVGSTGCRHGSAGRGGATRWVQLPERPRAHVRRVYGFLAFLAATLIRPAGLRRPLVAVLAGLIALVGPSRIQQGHHWPTDVTASYLLGTSYLVGVVALYDGSRPGTWRGDRDRRNFRYFARADSRRSSIPRPGVKGGIRTNARDEADIEAVLAEVGHRGRVSMRSPRRARRVSLPLRAVKDRHGAVVARRRRWDRRLGRDRAPRV